MKKEIHSVCRECGVTANVLTCLQRYNKPPSKLYFNVSTVSMGNACDYCGKKGEGVTSVRDYFYPDFKLIKKVAKSLKNNINT